MRTILNRTNFILTFLVLTSCDNTSTYKELIRGTWTVDSVSGTQNLIPAYWTIRKDSKVIFDRTGFADLFPTDTSKTSKKFQYMISDDKISFFFTDAGIRWDIEKLSNKRMIIKDPQNFKGDILISFKKVKEEKKYW